MVRAKMSEHVAMQIPGHRTRLEFPQYYIVSEVHLHEAHIQLAYVHGHGLEGSEVEAPIGLISSS